MILSCGLSGIEIRNIITCVTFLLSGEVVDSLVVVAANVVVGTVVVVGIDVVVLVVFGFGVAVVVVVCSVKLNQILNIHAPEQE